MMVVVMMMMRRRMVTLSSVTHHIVRARHKLFPLGFIWRASLGDDASCKIVRLDLARPLKQVFPVNTYERMFNSGCLIFGLLVLRCAFSEIFG
eukprot:1209845-Amphidinium_carterae.1